VTGSSDDDENKGAALPEVHLELFWQFQRLQDRWRRDIWDYGDFETLRLVQSLQDREI